MIISIGLLILLCGRNCVKGYPLIKFQQSHSHQAINILSANVTAFGRGTTAVLTPNNYSHILPPKTISLGDGHNAINPPNSLNPKTIEQSIKASVSCSMCKAGIYFLKSYATKYEDSNGSTFLLEICTNFKLLPSEVCNGLIERYEPVMKLVLNRGHFDVNEFCATITFNDDCMGSGKSANTNWEITLPSIPKPIPEADLKLPKDSAPTFKVLHITDTHYDPLYAEGAAAVCQAPLCCRDRTQIVLKPGDGAGKWGDYRNCDPPKATIDNMFDHILEEHPDIDYIIWTGDIQPHNVWSDTKEENLRLLREMVTTMKQKFPNIPIFPAIGNHETTPASLFPPPSATEENLNQWLLDEIDVQWQNWLPENVSPTIRYGGFYSILVAPGFRMISLNTNYCYSVNFWMLLNGTDSASLLQWLVYELQAAELANEKVHIIGHIPPGYVDCMRIWSRNYYKIIARFESTVTGQFFGHSHGDEIEVLYDPDDLNRATNILYIAPSVTPYSNFNPGYKIYYVDGDHSETSRMVIDEEGWSFDLHEANTKGNPNWYKLYSARASYAMDGLRPSDWNAFINQMITNDEMFDLYYRHYWRDSMKRPICDESCKKQFICDTRSGRVHGRNILCT